jgi:hypothetical protein
MQYLGCTYTKKLFAVYLKFKQLESCIVSGTPSSQEASCHIVNCFMEMLYDKNLKIASSQQS